MNRPVFFYVFIALLLGLAPGLAEADSVPEGTPCSGWNPENQSFNPVGSTSCYVREGNCPRGYAYTSVGPVAGDRFVPRSVNVYGQCCKLPDGMLTDEHLYVFDSCPEGFVATGAKSGPSTAPTENEKKYGCVEGWNLTDQYMRCTKLRADRFTLSAPAAAINVGWVKHFSYMNARRTARSRIPAALRQSVGRYGPFSWDPNICVGVPFGSLLTSKSIKYCSGFGFRQVLYRGSAGDPPAGTVVPLFPDCRRLSSPTSAYPGCVK